MHRLLAVGKLVVEMLCKRYCKIDMAEKFMKNWENDAIRT